MYNNKNAKTVTFPNGITFIDNNITSISSVETITFKGKPYEISSFAFESSFSLTTINVPFSEGEVSGAPWGATSATINYNYTGG